MSFNVYPPPPSGAPVNSIVQQGIAAGWGSVSERVAIITNTSTWSHPEGASIQNPKKVTFIIMGGGGGGGGGSNAWGGSGGGSGIVKSQTMLITASVSIVIGSGGVSGTPGGQTYFDVFSVPGGAGGSTGDGVTGGAPIFNIPVGGAATGGAGGSEGGGQGIQTNALSPNGGGPGSSFGQGPRSLSSVYGISSDVANLSSGGGGGGGGYNRFPSIGGTGGFGFFGNGGGGGGSNSQGRPNPQGGPFVVGYNEATPGSGYGYGGGGATGSGLGSSGGQGVVIIYY